MRISHFEFPTKHNRAHFQNLWSWWCLYCHLTSEFFAGTCGGHMLAEAVHTHHPFRAKIILDHHLRPKLDCSGLATITLSFRKRTGG